jgi:hypothetical protein
MVFQPCFTGAGLLDSPRGPTVQDGDDNAAPLKHQEAVRASRGREPCQTLPCCAAKVKFRVEQHDAGEAWERHEADVGVANGSKTSSP